MAVVGSKYDHGIIIYPKLLKLPDDLSHVIIQHLNHGGILLLYLCQALVINKIGMNLRNSNRSVWQLGGKVEEERLAPVSPKKRQHTVHKDFLGIDQLPIHIPSLTKVCFSFRFTAFSTIGPGITCNLFQSPVSEKIGRIKTMRPDMVQVTKVVIPSMTFHLALGGCKAPFQFTKLAGSVPCLFCKLTQEHLLIRYLFQVFTYKRFHLGVAHFSCTYLFIYACSCNLESI